VRPIIVTLFFCLVTSNATNLLAEEIHPDCELRVEYEGFFGWKRVEHLIRNGISVANIERRGSRTEWAGIRFRGNPIPYPGGLLYELRDSLEEDNNYVFFSHRSSRFQGTSVLKASQGSSSARIFLEGSQGKKKLSVSYLSQQELDNILSDIACLFVVLNSS
jgi:hypothetical protein